MANRPGVIESAEDLESAIQWAGDNPKARWYVARMARAYKRANLIPSDWDVPDAGSFREQPLNSEDDLAKSAEVDKAIDAFADTVEDLRDGKVDQDQAEALVAAIAGWAEQAGVLDEALEALTAGADSYVEEKFISRAEMTALLAAGDTVRRVRTQAGVQRYKAPIGTPIVKNARTGRLEADKSRPGTGATRNQSGKLHARSKSDIGKNKELGGYGTHVDADSKTVLTSTKNLKPGDEIISKSGKTRVISKVAKKGDDTEVTFTDDKGEEHSYVVPGYARVRRVTGKEERPEKDPAGAKERLKDDLADIDREIKRLAEIVKEGGKDADRAKRDLAELRERKRESSPTRKDPSEIKREPVKAPPAAEDKEISRGRKSFEVKYTNKEGKEVTGQFWSLAEGARSAFVIPDGQRRPVRVHVDADGKITEGTLPSGGRKMSDKDLMEALLPNKDKDTPLDLDDPKENVEEAQKKRREAIERAEKTRKDAPEKEKAEEKAPEVPSGKDPYFQDLLRRQADALEAIEEVEGKNSVGAWRQRVKMAQTKLDMGESSTPRDTELIDEAQREMASARTGLRGAEEIASGKTTRSILDAEAALDAAQKEWDDAKEAGKKYAADDDSVEAAEARLRTATAKREVARRTLDLQNERYDGGAVADRKFYDSERSKWAQRTQMATEAVMARQEQLDIAKARTKSGAGDPTADMFADPQTPIEKRQAARHAKLTAKAAELRQNASDDKSRLEAAKLEKEIAELENTRLYNMTSQASRDGTYGELNEKYFEPRQQANREKRKALSEEISELTKKVRAADKAEKEAARPKRAEGAEWTEDEVDELAKLSRADRLARFQELSDADLDKLRAHIREELEGRLSGRTMWQVSASKKLSRVRDDIFTAKNTRVAEAKAKDLPAVDGDGKPLKIFGEDGVGRHVLRAGEHYVDSAGKSQVAKGGEEIFTLSESDMIYRLGKTGYQQWAVVRRLPDGRVEIIGSHDNSDKSVRVGDVRRVVDPKELTMGDSSGRWRGESENERRARRGLVLQDASRKDLEADAQYKVTTGKFEGRTGTIESPTGDDQDQVYVKFSDGTGAYINASELRRDSLAPISEKRAQRLDDLAEKRRKLTRGFMTGDVAKDEFETERDAINESQDPVEYAALQARRRQEVEKAAPSPEQPPQEPEDIYEAPPVQPQGAVWSSTEVDVIAGQSRAVRAKRLQDFPDADIESLEQAVQAQPTTPKLARTAADIAAEKQRRGLTTPTVKPRTETEENELDALFRDIDPAETGAELVDGELSVTDKRKALAAIDDGIDAAESNIDPNIIRGRIPAEDKQLYGGRIKALKALRKRIEALPEPAPDPEPKTDDVPSIADLEKLEAEYTRLLADDTASEHLKPAARMKYNRAASARAKATGEAKRPLTTPRSADSVSTSGVIHNSGNQVSKPQSERDRLNNERRPTPFSMEKLARSKGWDVTNQRDEIGEIQTSTLRKDGKIVRIEYGSSRYGQNNRMARANIATMNSDGMVDKELRDTTDPAELGKWLEDDATPRAEPPSVEREIEQVTADRAADTAGAENALDRALEGRTDAAGNQVTTGATYRLGRGYQEWRVASVNANGSVNLEPASGTSPLGNARNRKGVATNRLLPASEAPTTAPIAATQSTATSADAGTLGELKDASGAGLSTEGRYNLGRGYQRWRVESVNPDGTVNLVPTGGGDTTRKRWNVAPGKLKPVAADPSEEAATPEATPEPETAPVTTQADRRARLEARQAEAPQPVAPTLPPVPEPVADVAPSTAVEAPKGMTQRVYRILIRTQENRIKELNAKIQDGTATTADREDLAQAEKELAGLRGEESRFYPPSTPVEEPTPEPEPAPAATRVTRNTEEWAELDDETLDELIAAYDEEGRSQEEDAVNFRNERAFRDQQNADLDRIIDLIGEGYSQAEAEAEVTGQSVESIRRRDAVQWLRETYNGVPQVSGNRFEEVLAAAYRFELEQEMIRAEAETNGVFFNKEAQQRMRQRNQDASILWQGNERTARANASEELKAYWDRHGRLTKDAFRERVLQASGGKATSSNYRGSDFLQ